MGSKAKGRLSEDTEKLVLFASEKLSNHPELDVGMHAH